MVIFILFRKILSVKKTSINKFEREDRGVHTERVCRDIIAVRKSRQLDKLQWPELVFERSLDVGVNQELHSRAEPVPARVVRREKRRVRRERKAIDPVRR